MNKGIYFKTLASVAAIAGIACVGFTGTQLLAQNAALSKQVSELSSQVKTLQSHSESLEAQVVKLEQKLEPRFEHLLGYNR